MEKKTIRVYTDYKSPYAFVANREIFALEERGDVTLDWYPYILRIEQYLGAVETRNAHQWRRVRYSYMDARRMANRQGLTLYGPQRVFNGTFAATGLLFAKAGGFFRAYHDLLFERFFQRAVDIDVLEEVCAIVAEAGGDAAAFKSYAEGPGRAEVDRVIDEAEEMGVFGVPTLVLDGELFWGSERIPMVVERLEGKEF